MMLDTSNGMQVSSSSVISYIDSLVNKFFKILPMREESEPSLSEYILSFQRELIGCGDMITSFHDDGLYISILSILQFLSDNVLPDSCDMAAFRREVFHAISLCGKLKRKFEEGGASE